jgi:hypothetical protein
MVLAAARLLRRRVVGNTTRHLRVVKWRKGREGSGGKEEGCRMEEREGGRALGGRKEQILCWIKQLIKSYNLLYALLLPKMNDS